MTKRESREAELNAVLRHLVAHDAPPGRVAQIRVRCLSALAAESRRAEAQGQAIVVWRDRLESAMATGLSLLLLAGAVERALQLLR